MVIPKFDKFGNVPVGDLFGGSPTPLMHVSLSELHSHFVTSFPHSATRAKVWDGWMKYRSDFEKIGLSYATLCGGSFVTTKTDPRDVDLCIINESADVNALQKSDPAAYREYLRLVNTTVTKTVYLCDAYPLVLYPLANPRFASMARYWNYWTRVFGTDRKGREKAFFIVTQAGVL
jgi:hypothetical protein